MGLFGPPNVENMKARRDVNGLIKALDYEEDISVRRNAAVALGELRDARAMDALIKAMGRQNDPGLQKAQAKVASQRLKSLNDIDSFINAGEEPSTDYRDARRAAATALGNIGDARAVAPLIATLKDGNDYVKNSAADALVKIGASALLPLMAALKDPNNDVRRLAVISLGKIGDARALDALISAFHDDDAHFADVSYFCGIIVDALGEIGDPRAFDLLMIALKDQRVRVRASAAKSLGLIGDPRAVEPLVAALMDENAAVREAAAEGLGKLGWQPGANEAGANYWVAKKNWIKCLELGSQAFKPLLATLQDPDKNTRKMAAEMLEKLGWQPGQDESSARYWLVKGQLTKCAALGPAAVMPLIAEVWDANWNKGVIHSLGEIGDARAVDPLIRVLEGASDKNVKWSAFDSLANLYKAGQLDENNTKIILAHCSNLVSPHQDTPSTSCTDHSDRAPRAFPL